MRGIFASLVTAAAIAPPVIHEPFSALPCPLHPDTTIDVVGCQEHRVLRTDRAINGQVGAIFRGLRMESHTRDVRRRRAELASVPTSVVLGRGIEVRGGSLHPVALLSLHAAAEHIASRRPQGDAEDARPALTIASLVARGVRCGEPDLGRVAPASAGFGKRDDDLERHRRRR